MNRKIPPIHTLRLHLPPSVNVNISEMKMNISEIGIMGMKVNIGVVNTFAGYGIRIGVLHSSNRDMDKKVFIRDTIEDNLFLITNCGIK